MVSYKPILIAGLIMVVIGVIGVSITAPTVIQEAIPDTDYNIQSPPNEVEFRNPNGRHRSCICYVNYCWMGCIALWVVCHEG